MEINTDFHNKIASLCFKHFDLLPKTGKPKQNEWTVLSCIVLEFNNELNVIALGTGSKCIGKSKMSNIGDILNDSHAEVICKRSFLYFLYGEMRNTKEKLCLKFNSLTQRFYLMDGVRFHFFTTHVPCGDAAIFPKQSNEDFGDVLEQQLHKTEDEYETPSKKVKQEDIYRTGAKCLENEEQDLKAAGSGYHILGVVRTKPGRGEPTLSVSCSDKLTKWCHLGLQGALVSLLVDKPIYLSTFTIAGKTPFCKKALERSLYDRIEYTTFKPHIQKKIIIGQSALEFDYLKDSKKSPCPSSISWCAMMEKTEVAVEGRKQGVTKKNAYTSAGRLRICKLELFKAFHEICRMYNIKLGEHIDLKTISYKDVKFLAKDYQCLWKDLGEALEIWTNKDQNLLNFVAN